MTRVATLCSFIFCSATLSLSAYTVVFPSSAIEAAWELNAEEFKQEFPGIDFTDQELTDEGWYVRYKHENLTYFFGPIESEADARSHEQEMHEVRNDVVAKSPALGSSTVDVVYYSYDPRMGPGGPGGYGSGGPVMVVDGSGQGMSQQDGPDGQGTGGQMEQGQGQGQMDGQGQGLAQLDPMGQGQGQGQQGQQSGGQGQQGQQMGQMGQPSGSQGSQGQQLGQMGQQSGAQGGQQGQQDARTTIEPVAEFPVRPGPRPTPARPARSDARTTIEPVAELLLRPTLLLF